MFPSAELRSERWLRPLTRRLAAWGVWAALVLGSALPAAALGGGGGGVPAGTQIKNAASVQYSTSTGIGASVVSDTVVLTVGQVAGVDIEPPRVSNALPGEQAVFSHVVTNLGNGADTFDVSVSTPDGWPTAIFHDVDGDGALSVTDTLVSAALALDQGGAFPLLAVVDVPPGTDQGTNQRVDISTTSRFDPAVRDALTDEVRVDAFDADVTLRKDVDLVGATPGDLLTYTLRAEVSGTDGADTLIIRDTLPAGVLYEAGTIRVNGVLQTDGADGDAAAFAPGSGVVEVHLSTPPTGVTTVAFQARVAASAAAGSVLTNAARARLVLPAGATRSASDTAVTAVAGPADTLVLAVRKDVVGPNPATEGDTLTYSIEVANMATATNAVGVVVEDTLPAPLTAVGSAPTAGMMSGSVVRWTLADLAPGDTARLEVRAVVRAVSTATTVSNTAFVAVGGAPHASATAPTVTIRPTSGPDLGITKTASSYTASRGDTVTFSMAVVNGPSGGVEAGLVVVDTLPSPFVPVSAGPGATINGRVVTWSLDTLSAGDTVSLEVRAAVPTSASAGSVVNRAVLMRGGTALASAAAGAVTIAVPQGPADIAIVKSVDRAFAAQGEELTYTIEASVVGPGAVDLLRILDAIPDGTSYVPGSLHVDGAAVSDDPGQGVGGYDADRRELRIDMNKPDAGTVTVTYRTRVDEGVARGTTVANTARGTIYLADGTLKNGASTAKVVIDRLTMALRKSVVGPDTVTFGDTLLYRIEIENTSAVLQAQAPQVVDTLPPHLSVVGSSHPIDIRNGRVVTWTAPTLGPGAGAALELTVRVGEAADTVSVRNRAAVVVAGSAVAEGSSPAITVVPAGPPALSFQKTVLGDDPAHPGSELVYVLTVVNTDSLRSAVGLLVTDTLPATLRFGGSEPEAERSGRVLQWRLGPVGPGDTVQLRVRGVVDAVTQSTTVTNRAWLAWGDEAVGDATSPTVAVEPEDPTLDEVGVEVAKTVDRVTATPGDVLVYTVTARAVGDGPVAELAVEDVLPEGVTFEAGSLTLDGVSHSDARDGDAAWFDADRRAVGFRMAEPDRSEHRLVFRARIDQAVPTGASLVNRAVATILSPAPGVKVADAVATTVIGAPTLEVRKTVEGSNPAVPGDTIRYRIEVENTSSDLVGRGLQVVDTLPEHLSLVTATPEARVDEGRILSWTIPVLMPGEEERFEIVTEVGEIPDSVTVVNRARVSGADGEPLGEGESGGMALVSPDTAELALDLESEVLVVQLGETLPLTVDVTNVGQVTVSQVRVALSVPQGTEFVRQILQGSFTGLRSAPTEGLDLFGGSRTGSQGEDPAEGGGRSAPLQLDSLLITEDSILVYVPGELRPGESFQFRYLLLVENPTDPTLRMEAAAEGRRGNVLASATGRVVASNEDEVRVVLERNRPLETRTVLGRVFHDLDGDGVMDEGEPGVAGVEVWSEDGEVVTSDAQGKLSFHNMRPGRHAFRIDPLTLPFALRVGGVLGGEELQVIETNGWTSGRLSFPLASREARLLSDSSSTVGTVRLALPRGGGGAVFRVPEGWRYVTGSARAPDSSATSEKARWEPTVVSAADGSVWLEWRDLPADPAGLEIRLAEGDAVRAAEPAVVVAPVRSGEEREAEAGSAFLNGPGVKIFTPVDGAVVPTNKMYLGVRGEPMRPVALFVGDSLLAEVTLRPDGVHDFIGVDVAPGPQVFRVRTVNSWGRERWDSVRVHRSGSPATLEPSVDRLTLVADGHTVGRLRVRVLDEWGVPVVNRPHVTVAMHGGSIRNRDMAPSSLGHQAEADANGWVDLEVVADPQASRGELVVSIPEHEVRLPVTINPSVRPLLLTGVGQVSVGSGGENFGALTARGRLDDRTAITLSYDSRRLDQGREVFGRASDPMEEGRYTLIGDASTQRSVSSSRYQVSARIERGQDWVMLGDVQSSGFSSGLGLARYARSVPGTAARVTTGGVVWNAFGALTTQSLRQVQFRGDGSSGPFELGAGILPGTEKVTVEVRSRENAAKLVSEQALQRYTDYEVDYERGTLLLKRPAPSTDPIGNPIFLVVTYEGESGGDKSLVWGVRGSGDLAERAGERIDSLPVSVVVVSDHQAGSEFRMAAAQAGVIQDGGAKVTAEVAVAQVGDSTGVAVGVEGTVPLFDDRVTLSGEWLRIGDEFRNPSNVAARAGSEEVRAGAEVAVFGSTVSVRHERQDFEALGLDRRRTTLAAKRQIGQGVDAELRFAEDHASRQGEEAGSGAAEVRVSWQARTRLRLFAEARGQLWDDGTLGTTGSYVGGGGTFTLSQKVALEARHLRVAPSGGRNPYALTSVGVKSSLATGTKAWGDYQLTGGLDGRANAAVLGLNHQFRLGPDWRFQAMVEHRRGVQSATPGDPILAAPFERPEEDYVSGAVGAEFVPADRPYRFSMRAESKRGRELSSHLVNVAGDVSFNASLALLSKQEFLSRNQSSGGVERYTRQRKSLWGLAYRPARRDDVNVLFKFEWRDAVNPFGTGVLTQDGEESRLVGAAEVIWAPARDVELGARIAARSTRSEGPTIAGAETVRRSDTQFFGVHARKDLNAWAGLRFEGRGMLTNLSEGSVWDLAPAVVLRPIEGIELEAGYRFGTLQDPDFAVKSGNGWYLTLGTRFTESTLPTAAAFWRERFGR